MKIPNHVAIILDGNGRWAKKRGLSRNLGHYQGAKTLIKIANHANKIGVKILTVYAFSTENWKRPKEEVSYLMTKPLEVINENIDRINEIEFQVIFVGRRDRLPDSMLKTIDILEKNTKNNKGMVLQIALDYGSHDELIRAYNNVKGKVSIDSIKENLYVKDDVDLLIRTSGEQRLSNFLLWQVSYAELLFVKKYWPSFKIKDFNKAIKVFNNRNRRFGGL